MNILDPRTIMICYFMANALSAMVLTSLWRQNRRLPGLKFWLADFIMQFAGIALILLRGNMPNFLSMVVSNTLIIGGTLLLFIGLEKYTNRPSAQWHNYFSLTVFFAIQTYFTLVQESLQFRNVNISFFMMLFSLQPAWLILRRADGRMRKDALSTGLILSSLGFLSLIRIFVDLSIHPGNDFFKSGFYDSVILLIYQMLNLSLTFALFLMVNRRLLTELENDVTEIKLTEAALKVSEEKFFKAFQTSPYAITITRAEDGKFIDVNETFTSIAGITREEALADTSLGMNIWVNEEDRRNVVAILRADGVVNGREFLFRKKNGEIITGLFSAQMIQLSQNLCIFSSINDITERKKADEVLKESEARFKAQYKSLPIPTYTWKWSGTEFVLMDGNDFAEKITNGQIQKLFGKTARELYQDTPEVLDDLMECFTKKIILEREMKIPLRSTGETRNFIVYYAFIVPDLVMVYTLDITERKQAEDALRESEEKFRSLLDSQESNILMLDFDGVHHYVNQVGISSMTASGTAQDIIGKRLHDLYPAQIADWQLEQIRRVISTGQGMSGDFHNVLNGQSSWWHLNLQPIRNASGQAVQVMVNSHDITARKQAEEDLRKNEAKYRILTENMKDVVWTMDAETLRFLYISPSVQKLRGYTAEEIIAEPLTAALMPDAANAIQEIIRKRVTDLRSGLIPSDNYFTTCLEQPCKNGSTVWAEQISNYYLNEESGHVEARVVTRDITERKQVEEALLQANENLAFALRSAGAGLWDWDMTTGKLVWSPEFFELIGLNPATTQATFDVWRSILHPDDRQMAEDRINEAIRDHVRLLNEYRFVMPSGEIRWISAWGDTIYNELGTALRMSGICIDITERKQAEENIHQLNQMGRRISASLNLKQVITIGMKGMLKAVDPDLIFLFLRQDEKLILQEFMPQEASIKLGQIPEHRVGECMCGMAVQLNKPLYSADVFSDYRCTWEECKRAGLKSFAALPLRKGDEVLGVIGLASNSLRNFEEQAEFLETLAGQISVSVINAQLFEDVQTHANILERRVEERTRELREAQEQLVRHEKLAVLGQMASSVGHELRNPLAVITSALYYLKLVQPDADEKIKKYLDMIQQEVRTSEKIITDLLDFARVKSVDRESVSVSDLIRQTLERFPAPASVQVNLEIPTDLPRIFVDPRQMIQVLGNLTVNACQAMKDGGQLTVSSYQLSVNTTPLVTDNWILITVKDTGVGISTENMKKLFEPLFTTKSKGIGLGLAVSKKLTEANGGRIKVESEPGKGSTFTVWLPVK
jgi:PAS domain S-box-containing protein